MCSVCIPMVSVLRGLRFTCGVTVSLCACQGGPQSCARQALPTSQHNTPVLTHARANAHPGVRTCARRCTFRINPWCGYCTPATGSFACAGATGVSPFVCLSWTSDGTVLCFRLPFVTRVTWHAREALTHAVPVCCARLGQLRANGLDPGSTGRVRSPLKTARHPRREGAGGKCCRDAAPGGLEPLAKLVTCGTMQRA